MGGCFKVNFPIGLLTKLIFFAEFPEALIAIFVIEDTLIEFAEKNEEFLSGILILKKNN